MAEFWNRIRFPESAIPTITGEISADPSGGEDVPEDISWHDAPWQSHVHSFALYTSHNYPDDSGAVDRVFVRFRDPDNWGSPKSTYQYIFSNDLEAVNWFDQLQDAMHPGKDPIIAEPTVGDRGLLGYSRIGGAETDEGGHGYVASSPDDFGWNDVGQPGEEVSR